MPVWLQLMLSRFGLLNQTAPESLDRSGGSAIGWAALYTFCDGVLVARREEPFQRARTILVLVVVIVALWTIRPLVGVLPELLSTLG